MNCEQVEYLIIGGVAVNIHGFPRATGDPDIWYNPTKENFKKLLEAIRDFGLDIMELEKLSNHETKGFIRIPLEHFYLNFFLPLMER